MPKNKKTIAIDLDNVLSASAQWFTEFSNEQWGTNLSPDDFDEDWSKMWGVSYEEARTRGLFLEKSNMRAEYPPIAGAKEVLIDLGRKFKLIIITSRPSSAKRQTEQWVARHYLDIFSTINFTGIWDDLNEGAHKKTKKDISLELGVDFLVDDQPKHCNSVVDVGVAALLFGSYGWTSSVKTKKGVTKVKNWQEISEYFGV